MKLSNLIKFFLLIFISTGVYAQDFYTYKLFNNEFQAVFPGEPSIINIPAELLNPEIIEKSIPYKYKKELTQQQIKKVVSDIVNRNNIQAYQYADRDNQIAYTSQSTLSGFEYDIGEYKQNTKKLLDETIVEPLKSEGQNIISFSSDFNRKNNIYIAFVTSSYFIEGVKRYKSTKHIIYKKKSYKWTVMYGNIQEKQIFDDYSNDCKVIE